MPIQQFLWSIRNFYLEKINLIKVLDMIFEYLLIESLSHHFLIGVQSRCLSVGVSNLSPLTSKSYFRLTGAIVRSSLPAYLALI